jgi:hypothetical protein
LSVAQIPDFGDNLRSEYLRGLLQQGLISELTGNAHCHLTYDGICEYSRLRYRQIMGNLEGYYQIRQQLRRKFSGLTGEGVQRIAFYGTGVIAEAGHGALCGLPLRLVAVVNDYRDPVNFYQFRLEPPEILPSLGVDRILLCTGHRLSTTYERLGRLGIPKEKVLCLSN